MCSMPHINASSLSPITHPVDVTAQWLTEALISTGLLGEGGQVSAVTPRPYGTGQSADSSRFTIEYADDGPHGPRTLVGKFSSNDPSAREIAAVASMYSREVQFYGEIASEIEMRVPQAVFASVSENGQDFAILMEDLAPAQTVDQIAGCTVDQAALAMEQAAALHSSSWARPDLQSRPWLRSMTDALVMTSEVLSDFHPTFIQEFGNRISPRTVRASELVRDHARSWASTVVDPVCLWHNDFRPDNMLFSASDGNVPLAVVDWQTLVLGPGVADVSYFLGAGLTVENRRAHEQDLVAEYHRALIAGGVENYSFETCWNDYRRHSIHGLFTIIHASVRSKRTERGDDMWSIWADRSATQIDDLNSIDALPVQ